MTQTKKLMKTMTNLKNNPIIDPYMEHRVLSQEEVAELSKKILNGCEQSRQILFEHNFKLARMIAAQKAKRYVSIPKEEIEHLVLLGIWDATKNYDAEKGTFANHASWTIRRRLNDYMNKCLRVVKIPVDAKVEAHHLTEAINIDDSPEEDGGWAVKYNFEYPEDTFIRDTINEGLSLLQKKERNIVEHYFGLNGKDRKGLRELSEDHSCSHEWVRIIQKKALNKIKESLIKSGVTNCDA